MNILTIEHLTRVYGTGPTAVTALDDVSFTVDAGEFVVIVGSSGSGKSTLMHLMGGVGRALMNAPAVILADEPTGNLDTKNSAEIMALLRSSNRQLKQTLIVITHDEDIALMADRVIAIEDGRIVRDERRA